MSAPRRRPPSTSTQRAYAFGAFTVMFVFLLLTAAVWSSGYTLGERFLLQAVVTACCGSALASLARVT